MPRNLHLAALFLALLPVSSAWAVETPLVAGETAQAMPAIRRIAVAPITSNLDEFRRFLRDDARALSGFAALPITEAQASRQLTASMAQALEASGRFWTLSVDATTDVLADLRDERSLQSARERLQKQYDLDVWLETDLRFSPDHTRIRVTLKAARGAMGTVWVREDVLAAPAPSGRDLLQAFHAAVARLEGTLGHDGRVTWQQNDLYVVDFGKERGLSPGQKLGAGVVALSARHPVSKEFLRARRLETLELEVMEVRQGSALCRLTRKNDVTEREALPLISGKARPTLLAWRRNPERVEVPGPTDVADGAEEGFPVPSRPPSPASASASASAPPRKSPPPPTEIKPLPVENREPMPAAPRDPEEPPEAMPSPIAGPEPEPFQPASWKLTDVSLGLGASLGSLDTSKGSRSTGIAETFANLLVADASIHIGPQLRLAPEISGSYFSGGDTEGDKYDFIAPVLYRLVGGAQPRGDEGTLDLGLGPTLSGGTAETRIVKLGRKVRVEQSFGAPDILAQGVYAMSVPAVGQVSASLGFYLAEIMMGEGNGTEIKLLAHPSTFVPRRLSFWVRARLGPGIWSSGELGVRWSLIQEGS